MNLKFDTIYFEHSVLEYPLGRELMEQYKDLPKIEISSHNRIPELSEKPNEEFVQLKQHLIIGTRKTHKYTENHKVSDWLVPYTSSGCRAMCLYCYLVCNYNKCSYLRLFVNRDQMMNKILKTDAAAQSPQTFEIGSNSDLVLENQITGNLEWTIEQFGRLGKGKITFPTKFDMVDSLLTLDHRGKTIFRMSFNPDKIIKMVEIGTSSLECRIKAINAMGEAGYPVGLLIAPVILVPDWQELYGGLLNKLARGLSEKVRSTGFIEVILMTYSYVQDVINTDAFPNTLPIFDRTSMTGRGNGKYCYKQEIRNRAETFLEKEIRNRLNMPILYFS